MIRTKRAALAVTAAVAVSLAATACGPTTGGQGAGQNAADLAPAALLKAVNEKTTTEKSAKIDAEMKIAGNDMTANGTLSWADGMTGQLTTNISGGAVGQTLGKMVPGQIQARYLQNEMYLDMGSQISSMLKGKHWIAYKYDDLTKVMGAAGSSIGDVLKHADPADTVRSLIASGKVRKIGTETVNGVSTTHYAGDVDAARLTAVDGLSSSDVEGIRNQLAVEGISTAHMEVWINSDHLVVRKLVQANAKGGAFSMTANYSDYGVPVSVQAPPASDTLNFGQLVSGWKLPSLGGTS